MAGHWAGLMDVRMVGQWVVLTVDQSDGPLVAQMTDRSVALMVDRWADLMVGQLVPQMADRWAELWVAPMAVVTVPL